MLTWLGHITIHIYRSILCHGRGDLIVHVEVRTPSKLSREQKKILEQLSATLPEENEPKEKGLFDKVRDYFS